MAIALAAIGCGISVADWVISPIAERLIDKCFSYIGSGSSDGLKELGRNVQLLKALLRAADSSPPSDMPDPTWMANLRAAYGEAEDIIDLIDYHRLESTIHPIQGESAATNSPSNNTQEDINNVPVELRTKLEETLKKIQGLVREGQERLSQLNLQARSVNYNTIDSNTVPLPVKTTSAPPTVVFGRDGERDNIIGKLHDSPAGDRCYSIIGIHGIPGSGKTTLAQHVCKKLEGDGDRNTIIMWIHVTKTFNEVNVLKEMLEEATGQEQKIDSLDLLQRKLKETINDKLFILVLDDVWYEEVVSVQKLRLILEPLQVGKTGSRVIMTSRTSDVAAALGAESHEIEELGVEQYLSMFMHYALYGATISEEESREYHSIGREIAKKLGQSPIAATTVASRLRIHLGDIPYWIHVMESDLWKDTSEALYWSYQQLEENVKQCFRFCSIFPRRYELKRDDLVHMWMAEGFVNAREKEDMEKVAKDYFHVLLSSSFIQLKRNAGEAKYTIHDLLHDLAEQVAGSDCFRVEKGMLGGQIPPDVRHILIDSYDDAGMLTEHIPRLEALRTLIMSPSADNITETDFKTLVTYLKKLRVLHVRLQSFGEIPDCIKELKHLRHLGLFGCPFINITLTPAFTKLYHLQKFFAPPATMLRCSSGAQMSNLVNLQDIKFYRVNFAYLGRMPWLRTLTCFRVQEEPGYEIHQLEQLDKLCGSLIIEDLQKVKSKEEALQANLYKKARITDLTLHWDRHPESALTRLRPREAYELRLQLQNARITDQTLHRDMNPEGALTLPEVPIFRIGRNQQREAEEVQLRHKKEVRQKKIAEEVLEALRPPFRTKSLTIRYYRGHRYPSWLETDKDALVNLNQLEFDDCSFQPEIKGCLYLNTLCISECNWLSLPEMEQLTSLKTLYILGCKKIKPGVLPKLPDSLETLQITGNEDLRNSCQENGSNWEKVKHVKNIV